MQLICRYFQRTWMWASFILVSMIVIADSSEALASRPNILFAIADDWGRHAGAYGTSWIATPNFDRIARDGLLFNNAFTPNAKCAPSRAIILTGRYSWQLEQACNHMAYFPPKFKSYPEALSEHGYFVGVTGKGWGPGIANDVTGKPRKITGRPYNEKSANPPATAMGRNDYAANFAAFLDDVPQNQPWCFWFGATEPHRPYEFGAGASKGGKSLREVQRVPSYWPDNDTVRHDMLDYAFEVEHVDRHLGQMLEELAKRNMLDNTLVVVTSDHGMPFPRVKGQVYLDSNRIPLAVRWPNGIAVGGRVIEDFVNFTDLAPTFLDAAGVTQQSTGMAPISGRSWLEIFRSSTAGQVIAQRDHVLIGKERHDVGRPMDVGYPVRGMIKHGFLYLKNFEPDRWPVGNPETGYLNTDGSPTKSFILELRRQQGSNPFWDLNFGKRPAEELYDLNLDPDCVNNLTTLAQHQPIRQKMSAEMVAELTAQQDPRMLGQGNIFDQYPIATVELRGFYERMQRGEKVKAGWVEDSDFERGPIRKSP